MAEAFAAVGLASSIVAFVDFAEKIASRLNEFSGDLKDGTNALVQIQTRLPLIIDGLRRIKDRVDSGRLDDGAKAALKPIVQGCHAQVKVLGDNLDGVLPASDASKWERRVKAIQSLAADGKVKKASEILSQNLQTLTFYHSIGDPVPASVVKKVFWLVPYDRNPNFVGRDSVFDQIEKAFKVSEDSQPKVALYGLGGIGKSQIALEYCFRKRHQQPACSVFWVNSATVARFEESFQRMAKDFGLNDGDDSQRDNLTSVKVWLETEFVDSWVMIIDNVDDETAFFREKCHNDKTPSQLLPRCSHGQLLFTSRTRDVAFDLASPGTPLSVDFLATEEGLDLLRKRLGPSPSDAHLIELLSELGHIPLAITQAISFMMKRRKSAEQYLDLYRAGERTITRLVRHEFLDHGRQEQTTESVARTWQISFDWIKRYHPKAAECLCLMAFYQHHHIPENLLVAENPEDLDEFEFEENLSILEAYSLVNVKKSENICSTHRLIQVTTKLWLEQSGPAQLEEWSLRALKQVTKWFPNGNKFKKNDYWAICQSLLPHADILLEQCFKIYKRESDILKATLLLRTGYYIHWAESDQEDVKRRYKESFDLRQRHLGLDHFDTRFSMRELFAFLIRAGTVYPPGMDSHEVAEMGRALLSHRREVLGPRHPHTIASMSDMADFLNKEGELDKSETMQREALRLSQEVRGHKSLATLGCMDGLATVLDKMDKSEEALELWTDSTKIKSELFGPVHRTVLTAKVNLAASLRNLGRLDEAISMGREAMALTERVLCADHPNTLNAAREFVLSLRDGKGYKEALDVLCYVLDVVQASQRAYKRSLTAPAIMELRSEVEEELRIDLKLEERSVAIGE